MGLLARASSSQLKITGLSPTPTVASLVRSRRSLIFISQYPVPVFKHAYWGYDVSSFPYIIKIYCTSFVQCKVSVCTKLVRTCWLCTECTQSQLVSPVVWLLRHRDYWAVSWGHRAVVTSLQSERRQLWTSGTRKQLRAWEISWHRDREREGPCHVSEAEHGCDLAWPRI